MHWCEMVIDISITLIWIIKALRETDLTFVSMKEYLFGIIRQYCQWKALYIKIGQNYQLNNITSTR